jgi:amino acid adenylation domain-containing protein
MRSTLPEILRNAAARYPEHAAVRCQGKELTWAELSHRAERLASILERRAVKRGDPVAFYLNKSLESVIAIYGIMTAGAAYVPLDPLAPIDRLRRIVEDCRIRCLITHPGKLENARLLLGGSEPCLPWDEMDDSQPEPPSYNAPGPEDMSYILYTSGSTGAPKGIVHTHASALAFCAWAAGEYGLSHTDRVSSHAPFHFDLSTFDLFSAAWAGATTVLVPEFLTKFPAGMTRFLREERISVWYSVPYALIQMLEKGNLEGANLDSLRWVLFAGEPFPSKYLRRLMSAVPARYSNVYGPTETNVCTYYHVHSPPHDDSPVPIGTPCPGTDSLVLEGELLISGPTVMRGYWGRPELDEPSFVHRNGQRYYRTGDLVKLDPQGAYHYLGRKDRQIKAHGYRIELDEIEIALLSHPDVHEAAAYTASDGSGSHRIEAAVIPRSDSGVTAADLSRHISALLPPFAMPSGILFMDDFPRTSTGKVDRREIGSRAGDNVVLFLREGPETRRESDAFSSDPCSHL